MVRLGSRDVPQANDARRVVELARWRAEHGGGWPPAFAHPRDRAFYAAALALIQGERHVWPDEDDEETRATFRSAFERSRVGGAWLEWARVGSLALVDPASAGAFLRDCADLSPATAQRRATTLRAWAEWACPLDPAGANGKETPAAAWSRATAAAHAVTPTPGPEVWPPHFEAFVDGIRDGRQIHRALDRLARALSFDEVADACRALFVDVLGFEPHGVELTERVELRSAFSRLRSVARFGTFTVGVALLADSMSERRWASMSSHYAACFRLLPDGIVVGVEPGSWNVRVVYRQLVGSALVPRYRALVGPLDYREPGDTLLTWVRVVDLLRPRYGDDTHALTARVREALAAPMAEAGEGWRSRAFSSDETPPGPAVVRALDSTLAEAFVHPGPTLWGLDWVLRQLFPALLVRDRYRVALVGVVEDAASEDVWDLWRRGATLERQLTLALRVVSGGVEPSEAVSLELSASVPVPDASGRFLLEGEFFVFEADSAAPQDVDEEADSGDPDPVAGRPAPRNGGAFVTVDGLLRELVEDSLRFALRRIAARIERDLQDDDLAGSFRAAASPFLDARSRLPLVSLARLRRRLRPCSPDRTPQWSVRCGDPPLRWPSWACRIASDPRPPGEWIPVAGARLHPCGGLAVPAATDPGVVLALGGDAPTGNAGWWVAPWLPSPGVPTGIAARLADAASVVWRDVVITSELPEGVAALAPHRALHQVRHRLAFDVPGGLTEPSAPSLLVHEGSRTTGGDAWLQVPADCVVATPAVERSKVRDLLREVLGAADHVSDHILRLPSWGPGVVVGCDLVRRVGWRGVPTGWRAWIEVVGDASVGAIVDGVGRAFHVTRGTAPPVFSGETGHPPDVALGIGDADVDPDFHWYAEETGELAAARAVDGNLWLLPADQLVERCDTAYVLADASASPPHDPTWARHRDWWTWAAAHPAEAHRHRVGRADLDPAWERCAEILHCARLPVGLEALPREWSALPALQPVDPTPFIPVEGHRGDFSPERAWSRAGGRGLHAVRCGCGHLVGRRWSGRTCGTCGEAVSTRPEAPASWPAMALPFPVLHPWRKSAAAALLGLAEPELNDILLAWGPVELASTLRERSSSADPLLDARRRLALEAESPRHLQGPDRAAFGQGLDLLKELLDRDPSLDGLWLSALPLPPPGVLGSGSRLGEANPVIHPLLRRLQGVRGAVRLAATLGSATELLRRVWEVRVQRAVDEWFGDRTSSGQGTLAGALRAAWPLTRLGSEPCAPRGLLRIAADLVEDPGETAGEVSAVQLEEPELAVPMLDPPAEERDSARWVAVELPEEEGHGRLLSRIAWSAPPYLRERWLRVRALPITHRKPIDVKTLIDGVSLDQLLSSMDRTGLAWVVQRVLERQAAGTATAAELEDLIRRAQVTEFRSVRMVDPAADAGDGWALPPGQRWASPARGDRSPRVVVAPGTDDIQVSRPACDDASWPESRAAGILAERWLPRLIALIDEAGHLNPALDVPLAVAGLGQAVRASAPGVAALLEILDRPLPLFLPSSRAPARDAVGTRLSALAGVGEPQLRLVEALSEALTGWALGEVSASHPLGASWCGDEPPPPQFRRAIPTARHACWTMWRQVQATTDPVGMASRPGGCAVGASLALVGGLRTQVSVDLSLPDLPVRGGPAVAPPEPPQPQVEAAPAAVAAPSSVATGIRIARGSLKDWLNQENRS